MSEENVNITFTENGSTHVKRSIEDIANAANATHNSISRLQQMMDTLRDLGPLLSSSIYGLSAPIDTLGNGITGLGNGMVLLGQTSSSIYNSIIGLGNGFLMLSNNLGSTSRALVVLNQTMGQYLTKLNQVKGAMTSYTGVNAGYNGTLREQLRITDQSNRNSGSLVTTTNSLSTAMARASGNARTFGGSMHQMDASFTEFVSKTKQSELALHGFLRTLLSFGAITALTSKISSLADEWTKMSNRLRQVSTDEANLADQQDRAYEAALKTRNGMEEMVTLYTRTAMATENLKLSQEDVWQITETVAKSMKLNGGSVIETAQAMRQLSQAFNKGKLDGDEFRSIMENAPQLQKLFSDSLGVTKAQLYEMSETGQLSIDKLIEAIQEGGPAIDQNFNKTLPTAEEATKAWDTAVGKLVGQLNEATSATTFLYNAARILGDNAWLVVPAIAALGTALTIAFGPSVLAQIRAFAVATWLALGPWGLFAVAIVGVGVAIFALKDKFDKLSPATKAAILTFAGLTTVATTAFAIFVGGPAILAAVSVAFGTLGTAIAATSSFITASLIPAVIATAPIWAPIALGIAAITAAVYIFVKYKKQWADVWNEVKEAAVKASLIFRALPGVFTQAGRDILAGLVAGLIGNISRVINTVRGIASDIISNFKRVLGIASPSREFVNFGNEIGNGLVIGIDNSVPNVTAAIDRLSRAASPPVTSTQEDPAATNRQLANDVMALTNTLLTENERRTINLANGTRLYDAALREQLITQTEYADLMTRLRDSNTIDVSEELRQQTNDLVNSLLTEEERRVNDILTKSDILERALKAGIITIENYNLQLERLNSSMASPERNSNSNALREMQDEMANEAGLLRLGNKEREIQRELSARINDLKRQGIDLDPIALQNLETSVRELDRIRDQSELVGGILDRAFSKAENAFYSFVKTGKLDFKDLIGSLLEDLARFTAEETFIKPLKDKLKNIIMEYLNSSSGGNTGGGLLGSLFKIGRSFLGGGSGGIDPELMTFANGGTFKVGGSGGVDSQVVKFRASPREHVRVYRSNENTGNSSSGSGTVNYYSIDARNSSDPAAVEASVEAAIGRHIPNIIKTAKYETIKDVQQIATRQRL